MKVQVGFNMNYKLLYSKLVENFKSQKIQDDIYTEVHHIIPRHSGGTDLEENLVVVTYRQHRLLHKVRFKAFGEKGDFIAYRLMYSIEPDKKWFLCSEAGKIGGRKNAESGHLKRLSELYGRENGLKNICLLNRVRHLANNEAQRNHASQLGKARHANGELLKSLEMAWVANRGRQQSELEREHRSNVMKKRMQNPEHKEKLMDTVRKSAKKRSEDAAKRSAFVIETAVRNEEWLSKKSHRSLYSFISPEGLVFDSPIFASNYYGNVKSSLVESWCKNFKYGWKVVLKSEEE